MMKTLDTLEAEENYLNIIKINMKSPQQKSYLMGKD